MPRFHLQPRRSVLQALTDRTSGFQRPDDPAGDLGTFMAAALLKLPLVLAQILDCSHGIAYAQCFNKHGVGVIFVVLNDDQKSVLEEMRESLENELEKANEDYKNAAERITTLTAAINDINSLLEA